MLIDHFTDIEKKCGAPAAPFCVQLFHDGFVRQRTPGRIEANFPAVCSVDVKVIPHVISGGLTVLLRASGCQTGAPAILMYILFTEQVSISGRIQGHREYTFWDDLRRLTNITPSEVTAVSKEVT